MRKMCSCHKSQRNVHAVEVIEIKLVYHKTI